MPDAFAAESKLLKLQQRLDCWLSPATKGKRNRRWLQRFWQERVAKQRAVIARLEAQHAAEQVAQLEQRAREQDGAVAVPER